MKSYNEYDLSGEFGVGITHNSQEEFYFDLEDYPIICDLTWSDYDNKLVAIDYPDGQRKKVYMARIVLNLSDRSLVVKYKNGNTFDCRKENLYVTRNKKSKVPLYDV